MEGCRMTAFLITVIVVLVVSIGSSMATHDEHSSGLVGPLTFLLRVGLAGWAFYLLVSL